MAPGGRTPSLPRGRLHEKAALQAALEAGGVTHPHHSKQINKIKYTIYEEKGEKSQTEKRWERRCVEVQQEGKGKEGEKRRKE